MLLQLRAVLRLGYFVCLNALCRLVLRHGSGSCFASLDLSLHSCDGTLHNWIRRINPSGENTRAWGRLVSYGREHRLSQYFCRLNFNGGNVPDLQNEFIQDQGGQLQIANNVSGVPCHYIQGRGQLPPLRQAAA
jgi:hypothetical protein